MNNSSNTPNTPRSDRPFWDRMMNLAPIKWFCNLKICRKCMEIKLFQLIFNYEMITYIFYGVLTTLLNLLIYYGFYGVFVSILGPVLGVSVINVIAWLIAMLFAFFTNKLIVFKSKSMTFSVMIKELIAFAAARLASLGLEMLIVVPAAWLFPDNRPVNYIAKIIAQIVVVIANYIFSKLFIFKNKSNKEQTND